MLLGLWRGSRISAVEAKGFERVPRLGGGGRIGREGEMQDTFGALHRHEGPGMDFGQDAAAQRMRRERRGFGVLLFGHTANSQARFLSDTDAIRLSSLATPDMKYIETIHRILALQRVAGLAQEMRNVDGGEGIGAFDDQTLAGGQPS